MKFYIVVGCCEFLLKGLSFLLTWLLAFLLSLFPRTEFLRAEPFKMESQNTILPKLASSLKTRSPLSLSPKADNLGRSLGSRSEGGRSLGSGSDIPKAMGFAGDLFSEKAGKLNRFGYSGKARGSKKGGSRAESRKESEKGLGSKSQFPSDLESFVRRFVELSPVISASAAQERAAFWELKSARVRIFPEIYLSGEAMDSRSPLSAFGIPQLSGFSERELYIASLNVEQPIYLGGSIWSGYRFKELGYKDSKLRHVANQQGETARFIGSVIDFLSLNEQIAIIKKSQRTQKKFLQLTGKRHKKGIAKLYELQQAEAESLSFIPRIEQLEQERQVLLKQFKIQLGMDSYPDITIQWPEKKVTGLSLQANSPLLNLARKQRSDYQQALIQVERAETQKDLSLSQHRPSLSLMARWGSKSTQVKGLGEKEAEDRSLSLKLKIPLFSGFSSVYTRRAGQESVESAKKQLNQLEQNLQLELKKNVLNYKSSLNRLRQIRRWHNKARQALQSGERSYRLGVIGSFQIHQLQGASERASLSLIQARARVRSAELNYNLAMGVDLYQRYGGSGAEPNSPSQD